MQTSSNLEHRRQLEQLTGYQDEVSLGPLFLDTVDAEPAEPIFPDLKIPRISSTLLQH